MISQAAIKTMMIDILNKEEQFLYRLQDDSLEYIVQNVFKCEEMPKKRTDFAFKERFSTYFLEYLEKTGQLQELKDCRENSIDESKKQKIQLKLNVKQAIEEAEKKPSNILPFEPQNIIILSDSEEELPALPEANGQVQTPNLVIKEPIFDFAQIVQSQMEKQENNFNGERPLSSKVQPMINKLPTESQKQEGKKKSKQSKIQMKKDKQKQNQSQKNENQKNQKGRRQSLDQIRKEVQLFDLHNKRTQFDKSDIEREKEIIQSKSKSKSKEIEKKSDKDKEKTPSSENRTTLQIVDQLKSANSTNNHINIKNNNINNLNIINQAPLSSASIKQIGSLPIQPTQPRGIDIIQTLNKVSLTEKPLEKPLTTPQIATPSCSMKKNTLQFFNQPIIEKNTKKTNKNEKECGKQQKDIETSKIIYNLESPSQNKQFNCHYCKYNVFQQTIAIDGDNRICCSCFLDRINPFSLNVKNLGVLEYTFQNKNQFKFTQDFCIDDKLLEKAGLNIEIRCIQMSKSALSDITFPNSCSIHIDHILIKEFKPLLDKSCLKKRKDQSIILPLNEFTKLYGKKSKHNLTITEILPDSKMRTDSKDPYYFGIYLIESIIPKQLLNHIMSSNEEKLLQLHPQNEVRIDKTKASLICQFSLELIQVPARGIYCQHLQCFSLNNYLEMQYKTEHRRWTCPVCKKVSFNLIIDKYQQKILNKIKLLELNLDCIVLDQDGLLDKDDPLNLIVQNDEIQTYQQLLDKGFTIPRKLPYIEEDDEEMPKIIGKQESTAIIID